MTLDTIPKPLHHPITPSPRLSMAESVTATKPVHLTELSKAGDGYFGLAMDRNNAKHGADWAKTVGPTFFAK